MTKNNDVISHEKSEIMSIIKDFREMIRTYGFKYEKSTLKQLRFSLRPHEKIVNDEKEDDIEYLEERVDYLKNLLKSYIKQNQYHDHNIKYYGMETIKYLLNGVTFNGITFNGNVSENSDEDYNLYLIKINNINHIRVTLY